jgi:voltage-gated potassium channel
VTEPGAPPDPPARRAASSRPAPRGLVSHMRGHPRSGIARAQVHLRKLYHGHSPQALRFQMAALTVDLSIIALFILTPVLRGTDWFLIVDYAVAGILALDMGARLFAAREKRRWLVQPIVFLDVAILLTLLFPEQLWSLSFLRVLRLWSLSQTGILWRPLRRRGHGHVEHTARAVVNLLTFLFLATGFIYTFFFSEGAGLTGYVDALYFTVTSVTTTGYGDITLPGPWGKLTAIVIMIIGITLFVRLAQAVFRPEKVFFTCPKCALTRHDPDAVHCKHCGEVLAIPDEGA